MADVCEAARYLVEDGLIPNHRVSESEAEKIDMRWLLWKRLSPWIVIEIL